MLKKAIFILIVVKLFPHRYYLSVPPCLRVRLSQMFELLGIGSLCYVHRQERDIYAVMKLRANSFSVHLLPCRCLDLWTVFGPQSGRCLSRFWLRLRIWTLFAGLDLPIKLSFQAAFVSYLVTNSICKLLIDVIFDHNTTFLNKDKEKQPFRSNSVPFIIASRTVYARTECELTTAFELLKLLQKSLLLLLPINIDTKRHNKSGDYCFQSQK